MFILQVRIFSFTAYGRNYIYLLAEYHVSLSSKGAGQFYMTQVQFVLLTVEWYIFLLWCIGFFKGIFKIRGTIGQCVSFLACHKRLIYSYKILFLFLLSSWVYFFKMQLLVKVGRYWQGIIYRSYYIACIISFHSLQICMQALLFLTPSLAIGLTKLYTIFTRTSRILGSVLVPQYNDISSLPTSYVRCTLVCSVRHDRYPTTLWTMLNTVL